MSPNTIGDQEPSDTELLCQLRERHNQGAFSTLQCRYSSFVLAIARACCRTRTDADDVFQVVWMAVWVSRHQIEASTFQAWLRRVSRNSAISAWRKTRRTVSESSLSAQEITGGQIGYLEGKCVVNNDPSADLEWEELDPKLAVALNQLPVHFREAIWLHAVEGWSMDDLVEYLGRSYTAVASILHRARKRLCELLTPPGA